MPSSQVSNVLRQLYVDMSHQIGQLSKYYNHEDETRMPTVDQVKVEIGTGLGKRQISIPREILICASPVFERMFAEDNGFSESQPGAIARFPADSAKDFVAFLEFSLPSIRRPIRDETVKGLATLADKYDICAVSMACQRHLMSDDCKLTMGKRLRLADKFRFDLLQRTCLDDLAKRPFLLERIVSSHRFRELSDHLRSELNRAHLATVRIEKSASNEAVFFWRKKTVLLDKANAENKEEDVREPESDDDDNEANEIQENEERCANFVPTDVWLPTLDFSAQSRENSGGGATISTIRCLGKGGDSSEDDSAREIYVSRDILALCSPELCTAVRDDSLLEFPHDDPIDWLRFLNALHPNGRREPVSAEAVHSLALLAHRYKVIGLSRECERFLRSDSASLTLPQKLYFVDQYKYKRLYDDCFHELVLRPSDLHCIFSTSEPDWTRLSLRLRNSLKERVYKRHQRDASASQLFLRRIGRRSMRKAKDIRDQVVFFYSRGRERLQSHLHTIL